MSSVDVATQTYLASIRTSFVTDLMYILTVVFDVTTFYSAFTFILIVLCVAVLIHLVRGFRYGLLFALSLVSGAILSYILKLVFNVSRPMDNVISVMGYSFPSYHATTATIFFGMLMYIFHGKLKTGWNIVFNLFCVAMILLVSFSRVYLGAHWLSDVIGGILLGLTVIFVFVKFISFKRTNMIE